VATPKHYKNSQDLLPGLVNLAFSHQPAALLANVLISLLLASVLWLYMAHFAVLVWLALVWLLSLCRYVLFTVYRRAADTNFRPGYWARIFSAGALAAGTVWGAAGVFFFSENQPQLNVFVAFALGGMVSGATSSMASFKNTVRIYDALLLTPIVLKFIATGQDLQMAMGLMGVIYGIISVVMSTTVHAQLLTYLRLKQENIGEINERRKAEDELRRHKGQLEEIINERTAELIEINQNLQNEVAERRQIEQKLKTSEEKYRNLVESISDWIWEIDNQYVYTYSSPRVETLLGYAPEEVIGKAPFDFMPENESARLKKLFAEIGARKEPFAGWENTNRHKDGRLVIVETSGEPIVDSAGELLGYRGIARNITERKNFEQELLRVKNLESLGTLAGGIAHDFNNLLTAVFGNIELARLGMDPESQNYQLLGNADEAIWHAKKLTGQLLTFSKGDSLSKEPMAIQELITETCHFVMSGSAVKCDCRLPDDLWPVDIDRGQIWRVLQNLLLNAAEAMPDGGTVTLTAENCLIDELTPLPLQQGKYVKIMVIDQGVGIPTEHLPKVFDPYYSTKQRDFKKGIGLGLTICHSIIDKHNGHISLSSAPGHGTTVTFYLPASSQAEVIAIGKKTGGKVSHPEKKRILLMEDEDTVIQVTSGMLDYLGYEFEIARQGKEAVEIYCRARESGKPFDLVILDLTIRGGIGGKETISKLLEIDPAVTALVASGYADDPIIANYRDHGFKGALTKPFRLAALKEAIEKLA